MNIKKLLLIILGFLFLGLGAIGIFLPVLPTTPFVILSAACFSVSPSLRQKVMRIKFFKEHIENYENKRGISKKTLVLSLSYLWLSLIISMLIVWKIWLTIVLFLIGTVVSIHILYMGRSNFKQRIKKE